MKKMYFVQYSGFANTYTVFWATADTMDQVPEDAEHITRERAIQLCRKEVERRKTDLAFSGYASADIRPVWADVNNTEQTYCGLRIDGKLYKKNGYIWEPNEE